MQMCSRILLALIVKVSSNSHLGKKGGGKRKGPAGSVDMVLAPNLAVSSHSLDCEEGVYWPEAQYNNEQFARS